MNQKTVVVIGMGDTGVLAAIHLSKHFRVIGISTKPCLVSGQELGARLSKLCEWQSNYLMPFSGYRRLKNVEITQGRVTHIKDHENCVVVTSAAGEKLEIHYDALLIASGVSNGFWRTDAVQDQATILAELSEQAATIEQAKTLAVVGGGVSGASAASNIKAQHPNIDVHFFFSRDQPLPEYHPKTQQAIVRKLTAQGVVLHANHRAANIAPEADNLKAGQIQWQGGQPPFAADCILWTIGNRQPNNAFIPEAMLSASGHVAVDAQLRARDQKNIFAVGDIADTDPNRGSARNAGFLIAAENIRRTLCGKPKLKTYQPPKYRWGSILGVQEEGMRVFAPAGWSFRFPLWSVHRILFPWIVERGIYKGVRRSNRKLR